MVLALAVSAVGNVMPARAPGTAAGARRGMRPARSRTPPAVAPDPFPWYRPAAARPGRGRSAGSSVGAGG